MKISGISSNSVINIYKKNNNAVARTEKIQNKDTIEISKLGKTLKNYSTEGTIDNSEKIIRIKEQIENGTYNVDAKLTAKSILDAIRESKF